MGDSGSQSLNVGAARTAPADVTSTPRTQLPPRLLPVLYFTAAHVALALAFGAVASDPRGVSGFFYHARMLAIASRSEPIAARNP